MDKQPSAESAPLSLTPEEHMQAAFYKLLKERTPQLASIVVSSSSTTQTNKDSNEELPVIEDEVLRLMARDCVQSVVVPMLRGGRRSDESQRAVAAAANDLSSAFSSSSSSSYHMMLVAKDGVTRFKIDARKLLRYSKTALQLLVDQDFGGDDDDDAVATEELQKLNGNEFPLRNWAATPTALNTLVKIVNTTVDDDGGVDGAKPGAVDAGVERSIVWELAKQGGWIIDASSCDDEDDDDDKAATVTAAAGRSAVKKKSSSDGYFCAWMQQAQAETTKNRMMTMAAAGASTPQQPEQVPPGGSPSSSSSSALRAAAALRSETRRALLEVAELSCFLNIPSLTQACADVLAKSLAVLYVRHPSDALAFFRDIRVKLAGIHDKTMEEKTQQEGESTAKLKTEQAKNEVDEDVGLPLQVVLDFADDIITDATPRFKTVHTNHPLFSSTISQYSRTLYVWVQNQRDAAAALAKKQGKGSGEEQASVPEDAVTGAYQAFLGAIGIARTSQSGSPPKERTNVNISTYNTLFPPGTHNTNDVTATASKKKSDGDDDSARPQYYHLKLLQVGGLYLLRLIKQHLLSSAANGGGGVRMAQSFVLDVFSELGRCAIPAPQVPKDLKSLVTAMKHEYAVDRWAGYAAGNREQNISKMLQGKCRDADARYKGLLEHYKPKPSTHMFYAVPVAVVEEQLGEEEEEEDDAKHVDETSDDGGMRESVGSLD